MDKNKKELLQKEFRHEMRYFMYYTVFLFFLFGAFTTYQRLLLDDFSDATIPYGYSLIEALILAKIILIGQTLHLGEKFSNSPLIYSVLYKTFVFGILFVIFKIVEDMLTGFIHGNSLTARIFTLTSRELTLIAAKTLIMLIIFLLFFSFIETARVLGQDQFFRLFFKRRDFTE